jgi:tetratricopeptide (TPR) repeat protein
MTGSRPGNEGSIVEEFLQRLVDGEGDRSILEEYCRLYPSLRETFERKYEVVTLINEAFREDLLAGETIGDFLICEEIGRGGMGTVYLALQQPLDRYVALKILPAAHQTGRESIRGMQTEARMIARFNHPNIVPIFSTGSDKGIYYIAMALIPGLPLSKVIEVLRSLPPDQVKASSIREMMVHHPDLARISLSPNAKGQQGSIMMERDRSFWNQPYPAFVLSLCSEIADALGYAHANGVCHGDLKPSNIMLTTGGIPMIVDFGLARDLGALASVQSRDFLGTLAYASPEQLSGNLRSETSDIWSLGVTMYEMLTLHQPFRIDEVAGTLDRIAKADPPLMRSVSTGRISRDTEAVIDRCLEKEPKMRYASADLLKEEIGNLLTCRPVAARRVGRSGRLLRWTIRNRNVSLLALFLVLSAIVAAYGLFGVAARNRVAEAARYEDAGRYAEAVASYEKALKFLERMPFSARYRVQVLSGLGDGWSGKGDYERAIAFYQTALRLDPACTPALMGLGDVYFEKGEYDRTISFYNRVLLLSPEDRSSYYQRGKAYKEKGDYDFALRDFRGALKFAPEDRDAMKEILAVLRKMPPMSRRSRLKSQGFSQSQIETILKMRDDKP